MDKQFLDSLKQRYAYDQWRNRNTLDENLFIWRFFLSQDDFPGWQPHRIQPIEAPPTQSAETRASLALPSPEWPRVIQSIWRRPEAGPEALLRVDVFECPSREAAHEFLVRLLGEFQSPIMTWQEQIAVGDVAFAGPGDAAIVFARANLVHVIRNAGRDLVPVTEIARELDRALVSRQETATRQVISEIQRLESPAVEFQVGRSLPLEVEAEASARQGRRQMYKFFSSPGEVVLEDGRPTYQPAPSERQEVTVYAVSDDSGQPQ